MNLSPFEEQMELLSNAGGRRTSRNFTPYEKVRVVERIRNGESKASVSRSTGVPESTLRGWCKREHKLRSVCSDADFAMSFSRGNPAKRPKFNDSHTAQRNSNPSSKPPNVQQENLHNSTSPGMLTHAFNVLEPNNVNISNLEMPTNPFASATSVPPEPSARYIFKGLTSEGNAENKLPPKNDIEIMPLIFSSEMPMIPSSTAPDFDNALYEWSKHFNSGVTFLAFTAALASLNYPTATLFSTTTTNEDPFGKPPGHDLLENNDDL